MEPPTTDLDTDQQPPLSLPFAHFLAGGGLLFLGGGVASLGPYFLPIQASSVGTLHLLLAGWLGLTIMGAMVQFIPVWSGKRLHSERLSQLSLLLVLFGVAGVVGAFYLRAYAWFPLVAGVLLIGFWLFGYTVLKSLPPLPTLDITEGHFLMAILSLIVATGFGWLLGTDVAFRLLNSVPVTAHGLLMAHLTLTVFGFVTATIIGALYQLGPMFTQAPPSRVDTHLAHVEMVGFPLGVSFLATGRLFDLRILARFGATLVLVGMLCFALILLRRLWKAQVDTGPMLRRYWVVGLSVVGWVCLTAPGWVVGPQAYFNRFGSPSATHLLFLGLFTFTVIGTFYHVVPFIVWFHEYSDKLGYEPVPMVDDLYNAKLARVEYLFLVFGLAILWIAELLQAPWWTLMVGGNVFGVGVILFAFNMGLVIARHRPDTVRDVFRLLTLRRESSD